jgi:hypothetical protein
MTLKKNNEATARRVAQDSEADTDPRSAFWQGAPGTEFGGGFRGEPVAGHSSKVLLQWTPAHLYLLFVCPYEALHLRPNPQLGAETFELWNWDVAEVFLGSNFENIRRYTEFEVSPQGEWVDLDIDRDRAVPEEGWVWVSGCLASARIDEAAKIWYGFLRIPWTALDTRPAATGNRLRANFFRCQGADPERKYIAWQAPGKPSFHVPEAFGTLLLVE